MRQISITAHRQAGDICLIRSGHSHGLTNSMEGPMHFLVSGVQV